MADVLVCRAGLSGTNLVQLVGTRAVVNLSEK